jgi:hypothetical protein
MVTKMVVSGSEVMVATTTVRDFLAPSALEEFQVASPPR